MGLAIVGKKASSDLLEQPHGQPPLFQARSQRRSAGLFWRRVIFLPADLTPGRALLLRAGFVGGLLILLVGMLWVDREGLKDQADGSISFTDVVYFTMVTITTVGYGDIVPVTTRARLLDALVITPVRIFIWVIFLGTAYQLALRQFSEVFRMAKLQTSLDQHVIVCGFGHTGHSAVKELLARGVHPDHILVIDPLDDRVRAAVELGVAALRGDATQEALLKDAAFIQAAKSVIITAGRDDTNALILLTVRHVNPQCRVIVSAKEEENIKLFKQGGANMIIAPSTYGGYMLAAAVEHHHLADYLEDLLTAGGKANIVEEYIRDDDIGKRPRDL
ncbi:MAG: hypothetical protein D6690_16025, partial [Nitrospirae bacterium]